jgi:hypothetical protein
LANFLGKGYRTKRGKLGQKVRAWRLGSDRLMNYAIRKYGTRLLCCFRVLLNLSLIT